MEATGETSVIVSDTPLTGAALIDTLDKDQLDAFVTEKFGRTIDKRKRIETIRAEVKALLDGTTQRDEAKTAAAEADEVRRATTTPVRARHKYLKNTATGEHWEFPWSDHFKKNADLEPIWE